MSEAVGTEPAMPRLVGRQQNRINTPATSVRDYYQRSLAIPLLDTIISELGSRFAGKSYNMDNSYLFYSAKLGIFVA